MYMMQPSARQQELERIYQTRKDSRKAHIPHISISDNNFHVTEAIGSSYDDDDHEPPAIPDPRPLSFVTSPAADDSGDLRKSKSKRQGSYFDMNNRGGHPPNLPSSTRVPLGRTGSNEKVPSPTTTAAEAGGGPGSKSPKSMKRMGSLGSLGSENGGGGAGGSGQRSPPPALSRQASTETAIQQFPLNDIDYESSPAAVAQELSNLQAIRRMSMNVDTADPDLPSFGGGFGAVPAVAPTGEEDEDDTSRLFWVPARLHPELAPKEFKTFVEDRVEQIRRRSGDSDTLSVDGLERAVSGASLRRKKSMLSHQIDTKGNYEDGAERLERKRSKGMSWEGQTQVDLSELESLVNDPAQLMRRMSIDTVRRSEDSGIEVPASEDMPILPPVRQSLKRSTQTTYRKGSLRKGERVPFSKRLQQRHAESDAEESSSASAQSAGAQIADEPVMGLTRVQTEPIPPPAAESRQLVREEFALPRPSSRQRAGLSPSHSTDNLANQSLQQDVSSSISTRNSERDSPPPSREEEDRAPPPPAPPPPQQQQQPRPQHRQFQSRLASGPGRTTAQLPGYNNPNPLPNIIETLPDGTKVPVATLVQNNHPERKSSHELPRPFHHRGGAHMRPVPGHHNHQHQRSQTLDDISSHPSPLPGSGATRTDALTMVPTFEDRKAEKKDGGRKSSWKWILGNDDEEKKARGEDSSSAGGSLRSSSSSSSVKTGTRLTKQPGEKARLDVLQNSIDGTMSPRGRESVVLNREDVRLEEERKKESKKSSSSSSSTSTSTSAADSKKDTEKDSSLLSAIFRTGKKKTSDGDLKEKKRKSDHHRNLSPDNHHHHHHQGPNKILKPDIDYNWTRFSILEERAIYRMAHIKLANPRRALYSQVLLSNFMYSYLAKVQMMHPQMQIPAAHQQKGQQRVGVGVGVGVGRVGEEGQGQPQEFREYQRWQQQQEREAAAQHQQQQNAAATNSASSSASNGGGGGRRSSLEIATGGGAQQQQQRTSYDFDDDGTNAAYDPRSSEEEYEYEHEHEHAQSSYPPVQAQAAPSRTNGIGTGTGTGGGGGRMRGGGGGGGGGEGGGYSVSHTHDYLGYAKNEQPFDQQGLWDDEEEKGEEMW